MLRIVLSIRAVAAHRTAHPDERDTYDATTEYTHTVEKTRGTRRGAERGCTNVLAQQGRVAVRRAAVSRRGGHQILIAARLCARHSIAILYLLPLLFSILFSCSSILFRAVTVGGPRLRRPCCGALALGRAAATARAAPRPSPLGFLFFTGALAAPLARRSAAML